MNRKNPTDIGSCLCPQSRAHSNVLPIIEVRVLVRVLSSCFLGASILWNVERISYKHHLSIKKLTANELRPEIGGGILTGKERTLGNSWRLKGGTGETREEIER